MGEPKSVAEMMGEMLRDAAVLVAVFVPLDVVLALKVALVWETTMLLIESTLIVCAVLAIVGMVIERRRER